LSIDIRSWVESRGGVSWRISPRTRTPQWPRRRHLRLRPLSGRRLLPSGLLRSHS